MNPKARRFTAPPRNDGSIDAPCLLTSGDIARLLDVDLKTVHNWVNLEHLSGLKTKGGHLRFHRSDVIRFMRRLGYPVPPRLGGMVPRVACVLGGPPTEPLPTQDARCESFDRLFDAALAAASGAYEVLVVDLDAIAIRQVVELVRALRRREVTAGMVVVGMSRTPGLREAFVAQGGNVAIGGQGELASVLRFLTGAAA
jgi:excisionase family DNA binding protein